MSAACLALAGSLNAGTLTTDFGNDPGTSIANKPEITTLVRDGILKLVDLLDLNDPDTGQFSEGRLPIQGSSILPEIDSGQRVASFTATFKARVGGGTESSALGFSLVLANDFDSTVPFREGGGATTGLTISFDSIDGLNDGFSEGNDRGDAPGIIIKQKGQRSLPNASTAYEPTLCRLRAYRRLVRRLNCSPIAPVSISRSPGMLQPPVSFLRRQEV